MYIAKYLLSIEEFLKEEFLREDSGQGSGQEALFQRASFRVDEERRERAGRMRTAKARAACLGGGLLLQLAVGEAVRTGSLEVSCDLGLGAGSESDKSAQVSCGSAFDMGKAVTGGNFGRDSSGNRMNGDMRTGLQRYSVTELLGRLEDVPFFPLAYRYGENGKPYFRDVPLEFNLSHSGNYVLCAVAAEEIGADIQQHCGKNVEKIAGRFFSKQEAEAIAQKQAGEEREKLFYRLWARKEAYGKLTGKGVAGVLETEVLPREAWEPQDSGSAGLEPAQIGVTVLPDDRCLLWEEYDVLREVPFGVERHSDYSIVFCRFGTAKCPDTGSHD